MKLHLPFSFLLIVISALALSACGPLSKVSMPSVKIPFVGGADTAPPANDPLVPFDPHKPLAFGHTLQLTVYRGARDPSKVFSGRVMVDLDGLVTFKSAGKVLLKGLTVPKAARAIESAFTRQQGEAIFQVEIERVEEVPIVVVGGAVRSPGALQWFDGLTVSQVLAASGGHDNSSGTAVYVTHRGIRHFHAAVDQTLLEAGDVITFSSDL